jgi:hypothetical protein
MRRWVCGMLVAAVLVGCETTPEPKVFSWPMSIQASREGWRSPVGPGQVIETEHYQIFSTVSDPTIDRYLPGFMEGAHEYYLELTGLDGGFTYPEAMPMYVLDNRDQWKALTEHRFKSESSVTDSIRAGGYTIKGVCALWDIGFVPTLSVAGHEGLHQFFFHRLKHRIPMWAEEGMCAVVEGFSTYDGEVTFTPNRNVARYSNLRTSIVQNYWMDLDEILPMSSTEAVQLVGRRSVGYYGQLWSLILYIRSVPEYREGFEQMMADAQAGRFDTPLELPAGAIESLMQRPTVYTARFAVPLFEYYITDDLDTFNREWKSFARDLVDLR